MKGTHSSQGFRCQECSSSSTCLRQPVARVEQAKSPALPGRQWSAKRRCLSLTATALQKHAVHANMLCSCDCYTHVNMHSVGNSIDICTTMALKGYSVRNGSLLHAGPPGPEVSDGGPADRTSGEATRKCPHLRNRDYVDRRKQTRTCLCV